MAKDKSAQQVYINYCIDSPGIAYNSLFWANDPRRRPGYRNWPFILRPQQEIVVQDIKYAIDNGKDLAINKSRDEGATEIVIKFFTLYFLFVPESQFLTGSRKEEYVDKTGDFKTLFAKIDHAIKHLPSWLRIPLELQRNHLHIGNPAINSAIDGEATNENFGAGGRTTAIFLDEFGRVDKSLAESIKDSVNDVTNCVIYGSTHWYGSNHPFNKVVKSKYIKTTMLPWYKNPEKNYGLYTSPDLNVIEIIDIDYYRRICPEVFDSIEAHNPFKLSELEQSLLPYSTVGNIKDIRFVADACEQIPGDLRSPWHDIQEDRRSKRDMNQNIWMNPVGASDMYFDAVTNDRIRTSLVREPDYKGEVDYKSKNGRFTVEFKRDKGKSRLRWWGKLEEDKFGNPRPSQESNYIIACDISLGVGTSNSVAQIIDVNNSEQVGEWVCPNTPPEQFADQVVAICYWVGGNYGPPFLLWENNGGHGINFGRRVKQHGYNFVYINKTEDAKTRKRRNKYGWINTQKTLDDVLYELQIVIKEGLKINPTYKFLRLHSDFLVDELDDYIYYETGHIGSSENQDVASGARARHGDRVIGMALCVLGMKDQPKAALQQRINYPKESFGFRFQQYNKEQENIRANYRRYLY